MNRDTIIQQHGLHAVLADAQIITMPDGSTVTLHRVMRKGTLSPLLRAAIQPQSVAVFDLRALRCAPPDGCTDVELWISATMTKLYSNAAEVRAIALSNLVDLWVNPGHPLAREAA